MNPDDIKLNHVLSLMSVFGFDLIHKYIRPTDEGDISLKHHTFSIYPFIVNIHDSDELLKFKAMSAIFNAGREDGIKEGKKEVRKAFKHLYKTIGVEK